MNANILRQLAISLAASTTFAITAVGQSPPMSTTQPGNLAASGGRFAFGQAGNLGTNHYMLDTQTGRLWILTRNAEGTPYLQPVVYRMPNAVESLALFPESTNPAVMATGSQRPIPLNQLQFEQAVRSNWILRAQIIYDPASAYFQEVHGQLRTNAQAAEVPFTAKVRLTEKMQEELSASGRFEKKTK
jgi:hypothetical protein